MENWKRRTTLFLAGQTISLFGSSLVQYALMWHLTLETRSGAVMTGFILAGFLPALVLSPLAGVWADRYDRKKLIACADGFIALVSLAAAFILKAGASEIPLFFTVAALRSFGAAVHQPAVGAYLPRIVPQEELTRVNGINGGIQSALMLVSPVAAGVLLAIANIPVIFLIDVATAAIAISVLLLFVREEAKPAIAIATAGTNKNSHFRDFLDGLKYIRAHRYLTSFFIYMACMFFFVAPSAFLTTIQTARTFGPEVWRLTAIEIVFSIGMMAGGAMVAVWGGFRNRMRTILLGNGIMALCTLGLALSPALPAFIAFPMYLSFMGVFGIAIPLLNTPSTVLLQEHVEDTYLGRAFSVFSMISGSLMPVAMLVFGPLADTIAVEPILIASGVGMFFMVITVPLNRRLMEAGEPVASTS
jgi:MFS transporter, DHA3 family, macrolide efflux protein